MMLRRLTVTLVVALLPACGSNGGRDGGQVFGSGGGTEGMGGGDGTMGMGGGTSAGGGTGGSMGGGAGGGGGDDDGGQLGVYLDGTAAKGPFTTNSSVEVQLLDGNREPSGPVYSTTMVANDGRYSLFVPTFGVGRLRATGTVFDELTGQVTGQPVTLEALARISTGGTQTLNINLLSHLVAPRIRTLMANGRSLEQAVAQAEREIIAALGVGNPGLSLGLAATKQSMVDGDDLGAAYLVALSSTFARAAVLRQPGPAEERLRERLATMPAELADAGALSAVEKEWVERAQRCVRPSDVRAKLAARFQATGVVSAVPNLDRALDSDGDGVPNLSDTCLRLANPSQGLMNDVVCASSAEVQGVGPSVAANARLVLRTGRLDFGAAPDVVAIHGTVALGWLQLGAATTTAPVVTDLTSALSLGGGQGLVVYQAQLGDLTGDGRDDLVLSFSIETGGGAGVIERSHPVLAFLPGNGAGGFGSRVDINVGQSPYACGATLCPTATPHCVGGTCTAGCGGRGPCGANQICVNDSCHELCGLTGAPCGGGQTCVDGTCQLNCGNGPPCDGGTACVMGTSNTSSCRPLCGSTGTACGIGLRCAAGACVNDCRFGTPCTAGFSCNATSGACECGGTACAPGEGCLADTCSTPCGTTFCLPTQVCTAPGSSTCTARCGTNAPCDGGTPVCDHGTGACVAACGTVCGVGQVCSNGSCAPGCNGGAPCGPGTACVQGEGCRALCGSIACQAAQSCVAGVCQPRCGVGSACGAGETCVGNAECRPICAAGQPCPLQQVCIGGACVDDCRLPQSGGVCRVGPGGPRVCSASTGACLCDVDAGSSCAADQACVEGACHPVCGSAVCGSGQICDTGACLNTACGGATACPATQACVAGQCLDRCPSTDSSASPCPSGLGCFEGACSAGRFPGVTDFALVDVNGDAQLDVVAALFPGAPPPGTSGTPPASRQASVAVMLRQLGAGVFAAPVVTQVTMVRGADVVDLLPVDLADDGRPELVVSVRSFAIGNVEQYRAVLLVNDGSGALSVAAIQPPAFGSVWSRRVALRSGDVDDDGKRDLAVLVGANNTLPVSTPFVPAVTVLFGDGAGGLGAPVTVTSVTSPGISYADCPDARPSAVTASLARGELVVADLTGDGRDDLLLGEAVFPSLGRTFGAPGRIEGLAPTGESTGSGASGFSGLPTAPLTSGPTVSDVDGDGRLEVLAPVVVSGSTSAQVVVGRVNPPGVHTW